MDIQKEFEKTARREQFEFLKLDLTRQMHDKDCYEDIATQIAWKYFLAGFNAALK